MNNFSTQRLEPQPKFAAAGWARTEMDGGETLWHGDPDQRDHRRAPSPWSHSARGTHSFEKSCRRAKKFRDSSTYSLRLQRPYGFPFDRLRRAAVVVVATWFVVTWGLGHAVWATPPEKIVDTLVRTGKNLSAIKAVMAVSTVYDQGKSRQDIKGFLLYRRPSDFRFQGIGPGGNPLFELVVKWNFFELYIPAENKILKGGKQCFRERFPDVAELEYLIPLALLQWKGVQFKKVVSQDKEFTTIMFTFKDRIWRATLDTESLRLRRLERLGSTAPDLMADFGDFKSGKLEWLPHRFDVQAPRAGWRTLVRIKNLKTNPFLLEKNFKLDPVFSAKTEDCR